MGKIIITLIDDEKGLTVDSKKVKLNKHEGDYF